MKINILNEEGLLWEIICRVRIYLLTGKYVEFEGLPWLVLGRADQNDYEPDVVELVGIRHDGQKTARLHKLNRKLTA